MSKVITILGVVLLLLAYISYDLLQGAMMWLVYFPVVLGFCCMVVSTILYRKELKHISKSKAVKFNFVTIITGILVFVFIILLNVIVDRYKYTVDITRGQNNTLSLQTSEILKSLQQEIQIVAFPDDLSRRKIEDVLKLYADSSSLVRVKVIDAKINPEIAQAYEVRTFGQAVIEFVNQEQKSEKKRIKIDSINELNITSAIDKMFSGQVIKVYFLEGHGERSFEDSKRDGVSYLLSKLKAENIEYAPLNLLKVGNIPDEASALFIVGPTKLFLEREIKIFHTYLNNGGKLFVSIDPGQSDQMREFVAKYGVKPRNDMVVDPVSKLMSMSPTMPLVTYSKFHEVTKALINNPSIFSLASSLLIARKSDYIYESLAMSGAQSWGEVKLKSSSVKKDREDAPGPLDLVVAVQPKDSNKSQMKLIVSGDSDFMSNQVINFNGNLDFSLNIISWLAGSNEGKLNIRPKESHKEELKLWSNIKSQILWYLYIFVLPLTFMIIGTLIWYNRKKL